MTQFTLNTTVSVKNGATEIVGKIIDMTIDGKYITIENAEDIYTIDTTKKTVIEAETVEAETVEAETVEAETVEANEYENELEKFLQDNRIKYDGYGNGNEMQFWITTDTYYIEASIEENYGSKLFTGRTTNRARQKKHRDMELNGKWWHVDKSDANVREFKTIKGIGNYVLKMMEK